MIVETFIRYIESKNNDNYHRKMTDALAQQEETPRYNVLRGSNPSKIAKPTANGVSFSLPAGPDFSCPGASKACLGCYAQGGNFQFKEPINLNASNWLIVKKLSDQGDVVGLARAIDNVLGDENRTGIFRIHTSGDFFSQTYIDAWAKVIQKRKKITFWAYTRSFMFDFSRLVSLNNFKLWASTDSYNEEEAKKFRDKYDNRVLQAYGPLKHDDPLPDHSFGCPVTTGKMKTDAACERCKLCLPGEEGKRFNRTEKNVAFYDDLAPKKSPFKVR